MAKFQLQENERLIGSVLMAHKHKKSLGSQPTRGNLYVTNQRVCYYESWTNYVYMDLPLSQVAGYDTKRSLFIPYVYIFDQSGTRYAFSGFGSKKLADWLEQAGVKKLAQ